MSRPVNRACRSLWVACALSVTIFAGRTHANEVWVEPTSQADIGGLGVASNSVWPVTRFGMARFAWAIPDDLQTFEGAKIAIIPSRPGGASTLNVFVCPAQNGDVVTAACAGPFPQAFTGVANQLVEVDISATLSSRIGPPGANYLAVLAYTTPPPTTDHIVGLRFSYASTALTGVATLAANTFTGTQTAPTFSGTFVGNGSGLTSLPFPAGAATLGANTFAGVQSAPGFVGGGTGLTGVAKLTANTFTGTQTISNGNLDLDVSTATTGNITKNGAPFVHSFGSFNAFLGVQAGNLSMTGQNNVAVGFQSLMFNAGGTQNSALGSQSLVGNTTGGLNTAVGYVALGSNTTRDANTAIGAAALVSSGSGIGNTAIGASAMLNNLTGNSNTAIGFDALANNHTGGENVAVGEGAGQFTDGSGNIYLGANVFGEASESNTMRLGRPANLTKTFVAGVRGVTTVSADAIPVVIDSNGQLGTISSSVRFKEDIHDMADASRRLFDLHPVTFRYSKPYANGLKPIQFGLVAEEVAQAFPELAVRGADGNIETVHYETLNVLLLNEVQRQEKRIGAQDEQIHDQQRRMEDQQTRIERLERRLNELLERK